MGRSGQRAGVVIVIAALLAIMPSSASAHVTTKSGPFRVELGWGVEPALTGQDNFVQVVVSDGSGVPLEVPAGALSVEVAYGGTRVRRPLTPAQLAGELRAALVPTRAGTYSFSVAGSVDGKPLDSSATCGEATFDCVEERSDIEFPIADPSNGELAERLTRETARLEATTSTANDAKDIALVALGPALIALATALWVAWRQRRGEDRP